VSAGAPHQASVWLLDAGVLADEALAAYAGWLDGSECRRLARFIRPARRRQFLAGRVLARLALGDLLKLEPRSIRLEDRPGRAPLLASPGDAAVGFSISHSGCWVACALSRSSKIGLDIEVIDRTRDIDALAAQAFDEDRQAWLGTRPCNTRRQDFYSLWSRAEAQCKLGSPAGSVFDLSTAGLAIVLCCEQALCRAPEVETVRLPSARHTHQLVHQLG
jgi:4'-phosphopantetheinyl transferase